MNLRTDLTLLAIGAVALSLPACGLIGVEPDEIDVVEGGSETGGLTGTDGTESGTGDPSGDGDGDEATGDGDGDPSTGDGDGDATGDGDGDPSTGDGDGDATGDGDGDGDETGEPEEPCSNHLVGALVLGANMVSVADGPLLVDGSCGSPGPDAVYEFTADAGGQYSFTLASEAFNGALYLVGEVCDPVDEIACELEDVAVVQDLGPGQTIYVVVDADMPGDGTVTIDGPL